jgi:Flp pilus assembly protein TadG
MLQGSRHSRRRGAVLVESAIVYPVLVLLLLGLIVGGLGVFRYQQVACQARDAARWASVRGGRFHKQTQQPSPTADAIRQNAVLPLAAGMNPSNLTVQVQWIDESTGAASDWDQASKWPTSTTATGTVVTNKVRVTVTYQWSPEFFFAGPINLSSVSEVPMSY